jgi:hypothetical protein
MVLRTGGRGADRGEMEYLAAIREVLEEISDLHRSDAVVVRDGLELVLCGWQLHTPDGGRAWDVLGTAAQSVVAGFHDLPPVVYTVDPAADGADAWLQTVRLVAAIADRLDRMATDNSSDTSRSWWLATAAARLRAALPVPA